MAKPVVFIFIIVATLGCSVSLKKQLATSVSELKNMNGVVLYTFDRHVQHFSPLPKNDKTSFCLINCELKLSNGVILPLLDDYGWNQYIKKTIGDDDNLGERIDELILSEEELFLPPISNSPIRKENLYPERRLSDTKHKFELGNINGYLVLESDAIFTKMNNTNNIYIAFNIQADLIYYKELNEFVIKNATSYKPDLICRIGNHFFQDNFVVIDKVYSTSILSKEQISSMGIEESKVDRIEIPVGE